MIGIIGISSSSTKKRGLEITVKALVLSVGKSVSEGEQGNFEDEQGNFKDKTRLGG